jgi:fluoride exporter
MLKLVLVGAGGAAGAMLRYLISLAINPLSPGFPLATLLINVTGCVAIGFLWTALRPGGIWVMREEYQFAIIVGVLGGYTTFSTFGRETMALVEAHRYGTAAAYVALSNGLGLLGVWGGGVMAPKNLSV